jgi:glutathione synthase/RimK-type ligase-like ATP-grasp enzyme
MKGEQGMIQQKPRRFVISKWTKTKVLLGCNEVRPYIPDTQRFSKASLRTMLKLYGMVYVKPEKGTHGKGVIRVEQRGNEDYTYQHGTKVSRFQGYEALYSSLLRQTNKRSYLVQKGIQLMKYKNKRFDVRVMVQLSPTGSWETTGFLGKVAHSGKIVTNYNSGGKIMDVQKLLGEHLSSQDITKVLNQLDGIGVATAKHLYKSYPGIQQIGLDIGFDRYWVPWIIEVNTNPDPYAFRLISDKSMYKKVMRYKRAALKS